MRCPRPRSRPSRRIPDSVADVMGSSTGFPLLRCLSKNFTAETAIAIVPGALPVSNRCVIYSASLPSVISRSCNQSEKACSACLRFRMVFSAKDFSTSRAVCSGIASAVVLGEGRIAVFCVSSFMRIPQSSIVNSFSKICCSDAFAIRYVNLVCLRETFQIRSVAIVVRKAKKAIKTFELTSKIVVQTPNTCLLLLYRIIAFYSTLTVKYRIKINGFIDPIRTILIKRDNGW